MKGGGGVQQFRAEGERGGSTACDYYLLMLKPLASTENDNCCGVQT